MLGKFTRTLPKTGKPRFKQFFFERAYFMLSQAEEAATKMKAHPNTPLPYCQSPPGLAPGSSMRFTTASWTVPGGVSPRGAPASTLGSPTAAAGDTEGRTKAEGPLRLGPASLPAQAKSPAQVVISNVYSATCSQWHVCPSLHLVLESHAPETWV